MTTYALQDKVWRPNVTEALPSIPTVDKVLDVLPKAPEPVKITVFPDAPTAPVDPTTIEDPKSWTVTQNEVGAIGVGAGNAGFQLTWDNPGFTLTVQGVAGDWTIQQFWPQAFVANTSTPAGERKTFVVTEAVAMVDIKAPGMNSGLLCTRPTDSSAPGWTRKTYNYATSDRLLTKSDRSVHFVWWDERRLLIRLQGDGDWRLEIDGAQAMSALIPVSGVTYQTVTDGSLSVKLWEPGSDTNGTPSIFEALNRIPSPTHLVVPAGYALSTYDSNATRTQEIFTKTHNIEYVSVIWKGNAGISVQNFAAAVPTAFSAVLHTVDGRKHNLSSTGMLNSAIANVALLQIVQGTTVLWSIPCPQLPTETTPLKTWHDYLDRMVFLQTDAGKLELAKEDLASTQATLTTTQANLTTTQATLATTQSALATTQSALTALTARVSTLETNNPVKIRFKNDATPRHEYKWLARAFGQIPGFDSADGNFHYRAQRDMLLTIGTLGIYSEGPGMTVGSRIEIWRVGSGSTWAVLGAEPVSMVSPGGAFNLSRVGQVFLRTNEYIRLLTYATNAGGNDYAGDRTVRVWIWEH
jgi:hypothetical protein